MPEYNWVWIAKNIYEIRRLRFEDFLWIFFICLALVSMYGDHDEIEYLKTGDWKYKREANYIFRIVLIITLLVYLYFFVRNYHAYMNAPLSKKNLYIIKLLGSSLLIAGTICLLYFQFKETSFTGAPAI